MNLDTEDRRRRENLGERAKMSESGIELRYVIGQSTMTVRRPNFIFLEVVPPFGPSQAVQLLDILAKVAAECGRCYMLIDVSRLDKLSGDTRETASNHASVDAFAAMAIVGAAFPMRVAIGLLFRAVRALSRIPYDYPFSFFQTRAEACAWLKEQASEASGDSSLLHRTVHEDWEC